MQDVQAVLEGGVLLLGDLDEILQERGLWDGEGLGQDNVLSFWEQTECEFYEI